jgi:Ferredoxin thioredoxin reductase variable alpha chain
MPPAIAAVWLLSPSARLRLQSPSPSLQHSSTLSAPSITSPLTTQRRLSCHVSIKDDPSLSSSSDENIGRKIRVKVPLKVYHVARSPELDLNGMIGLVKHYVGNWKGKRITPNLPFKVEFLLPVEGQDKPVRFFAHLREGEFDLLTSDH